MNLFWVGPRESDINHIEPLFQGSITLFGDGNGTNRAYCTEEDFRINHNADHPETDQFVISCQQDIIAKYSDCRFMSYNPNCLVGAPQYILDRTICFNSENILQKLNNKLSFREFAAEFVPILPYHKVLGKDCTLSTLEKFGYDMYIIQEAFSSGGEGTYIMSQEHEKNVCNHLCPDNEYLVSQYYPKNIPINIHAVIFDDNIIVFPGSVQVVVQEKNRLLYRGADFIAYLSLPFSIRQNFKSSTLRLCQEIQKLGYRGVIGIDGMWTGSENVFILEVNNRFQGSSHVLNRALLECGLSSLQQYNLNAFTHATITGDELMAIEQLKVPYSSFSQINCDGGRQGHHIFNQAAMDQHMVAMLSDGYNPLQKAEENALLFTQVFNTNIVSICEKEYCVRLHPSLLSHSQEWYHDICNGDLLKLKIAVINQGATISGPAKNYIHENGEMREGTYFSLDLFIKGIYINCPLYVKFTCYSPFLIDISPDGGGLCLKYYGVNLGAVEYDQKYIIPKSAQNCNVPLDKICFLATDRLRLQNNSYCTFPKHGKGCRFCEVTSADQCFTENDVINAIKTYFSFSPRPFRHILIGGASKEIGKEYETILKMCKTIRSFSDMPIYLMCLPPSKKGIIEKYVEAGVTEFGFNMEVFDASLAKQYMPGKGFIPRDHYLRALSWAASILGHDGSVRCAFIAGLEPMDSLLQGIHAVCKLGVSPILSVFRPIPFTEMAEVIPPPNEWLLELTLKATDICQHYGLKLGPECPACQNNTLNIVQENEAINFHKSSY